MTLFTLLTCLAHVFSAEQDASGEATISLHVHGKGTMKEKQQEVNGQAHGLHSLANGHNTSRQQLDDSKRVHTLQTVAAMEPQFRFFQKDKLAVTETDPGGNGAVMITLDFSFKQDTLHNYMVEGDPGREGQDCTGAEVKSHALSAYRDNFVVFKADGKYFLLGKARLTKSRPPTKPDLSLEVPDINPFEGNSEASRAFNKRKAALAVAAKRNFMKKKTKKGLEAESLTTYLIPHMRPTEGRNGEVLDFFLSLLG